MLNLCPIITMLPAHMVVAASCCGDEFLQQRWGSWSKLMERCMELNRDWGEGSPSSRTVTINMQPELQWDGVDQSRFKCWNGLFHVQNRFLCKCAVYKVSTKEDSIQMHATLLRFLLAKNGK
ncbi:hypothetical protein GOODEAATRI_000362 [Goodea atripinnis]|uniref:Secreted protein n=1 Tax=Goodea atripinnis TaxID=208336 RepID=A0ABV0PA66_9TELE